jgi:amidase
MGLVDHPVDRPLRIGMLLHSPVGADVDAPTEHTFHETVKLLTDLGHEVIPTEIPVDNQFKEDFCHLYATGGFIVHRLGKYAFGSNYDPEALTDLTKGLSREFAARPGKTLGAIRRLRRTAVEYAATFEHIDVFLSPVVSKVAPPIGHLGMDLPYDILFPRVIDWACYTPYCNATGGPSISLPLGHDNTTNLPVGMLFSAAHGQERLLLELALQLETAKPWARIQDAPALGASR